MLFSKSAPAISFGEIAAKLPEHLAEFLGISRNEVDTRMSGARIERNRRWIEANPKSEAERNVLYGSLGELDLLKYSEWHMRDEKKKRLHDEMVLVARRNSARVIDCGGGIGDTTLAFAANGLQVSYIDFPGVCSEFARFRWKKYGCAERVTAWEPERFWSSSDGSTFDMAVSIDVLEHLENPVRHAFRYLELLKPGGELFVTTCFEHSSRNPDHLPENDAYHLLFGGERKTRRHCLLTNIGFQKKDWYRFVKV